MTTHGNVDDIPDPGVDELQQRPPELWAPGAVPVEIEGTPRVLMAGNRRWAAFVTGLTTTPTHILGNEPARSCVTLIGSAAWSIKSGKSAAAVPIPANVPIVLTHQGEIYATSSASADLSVMAEYHGD
jgi:hypothetical protein